MTQTSVVVIDGSNIATEGRSLPSLAQLDEAVRSFLEEYPHDQFIVVVDATFEHRIDPSERQMYDEALAANELLTPPAGTIGRGDAFILAIAEKAGATVFSNDSFQEFHGDFDWLFDEGRLIGGKPVPFIGWVFTARTPVRGQKSRQATRSAARKRVRGGETASAKSATRATPRRSATSPAANLPMPIPKGPPPGPTRSRRGERRSDAPVDERPGEQERDRGEGADRSARRSGRRRSAAPSLEPVNEGLAFVTFISEHAIGQTVEGEVTEFSSHGAYVSVGDARCYVPLSYLGDPPPRAAREVLERGETRSFVVQAIDGPRRAIDLALPGFEHLDGVTDRAAGIDEDDEAPAARRSRLATLERPEGRGGDAPVRRSRTRKAAAPVTKVAVEPVEEPVVRRRTRKGPARARTAPTPVADQVAGSPAEAVPADVEAAPRRRTAKAAPAAGADPVVAAGSDDGQAPTPRRRTAKAPSVAAAAEPLSGTPATTKPVTQDGVGVRRRTRPRKVAEPVVAAAPVEQAPTPVDDATQVTPPRGRGRRVAAPDSGAPPSGADEAAEAPVEGTQRAVAAPASRTTRKVAPKTAATRKAATTAPARKAATTAPAGKAPAGKAPAKRAAAKRAAPAAAPAGAAPAARGQAKQARGAAVTAPGGSEAAAAPAKRAPAKRTAKKAPAKKAPASVKADPGAGVAKPAPKRAPARSRTRSTDDA